MRATRHVLSEFGNMSSACVLFILDEMTRRSAGEGSGEGLDWRVLFGFKPSLTVETMVLHSIPLRPSKKDGPDFHEEASSKLVVSEIVMGL